ncbi:MAG TPA: enoyl-CoA hydratase-related protein [Dehalococcoidia bacterium]|nr:enoyl-CoA hydratase-related protein [Dehalococcoidia bacterium]
MPEPKILTDVEDHTFIVTINRADQRNCVDGETAGLLEGAAERFRTDDSLYVMVLTGSGDKAFCAGADLKNIDSLMTRPNAGKSGPMGLSRITNLSKPIVGAIEGYATAGGLELACWCDFRIASSSAQFGVLNRRWGVPLVDGGTQRLPQIVGLGNALYLITTGAQIDAPTAFRMGLVQEIVPPKTALQRAVEIANVVATYPQTAMRNDRKAALRAFELPLEAGLRYEVEAHADSLADPAMRDWLGRFAAGERPQPIRPLDPD